MSKQSDKQSGKVPVQTGKPAETSPVERAWEPLARFRSEMDRLFDDLVGRFSGFPFGGRGFEAEPFRRFERMFGASVPAVDLIEGEKDYRLAAELPGMDENDIEVALTEDVLTIKGEKKQETEEKEQDYYFSERRFGAFERSFRLPDDVDAEKIEASFKKGVLSLVLPKRPEAAKPKKKIDIKAE
jgi:HSP20 family protein